MTNKKQKHADLMMILMFIERSKNHGEFMEMINEELKDTEYMCRLLFLIQEYEESKESTWTEKRITKALAQMQQTSYSESIKSKAFNELCKIFDCTPDEFRVACNKEIKSREKLKEQMKNGDKTVKKARKNNSKTVE